MYKKEIYSVELHDRGLVIIEHLCILEKLRTWYLLTVHKAAMSLW